MQKTRRSRTHRDSQQSLGFDQIFLAEEKAKPGSEEAGGLARGLVEEVALDVLHALG